MKKNIFIFILSFILGIMCSNIFNQIEKSNKQIKSICIDTITTISKINIGDCYKFQLKSKDPFAKYNSYLIEVIDMKNGYIQYLTEYGFVSSTDVEFFLKFTEKTDSCLPKK